MAKASWQALARSIAIAAITGYQRHLSPHKGFTCAHRRLYGGLSCSEYVKRSIAEQGLRKALFLARQRFKACSRANQILHLSRPCPRNLNRVNSSTLALTPQGLALASSASLYNPRGFSHRNPQRNFSESFSQGQNGPPRREILTIDRLQASSSQVNSSQASSSQANNATDDPDPLEIDWTKLEGEIGDLNRQNQDPLEADEEEPADRVNQGEYTAPEGSDPNISGIGDNCAGCAVCGWADCCAGMCCNPLNVCGITGGSCDPLAGCCAPCSGCECGNCGDPLGVCGNCGGLDCSDCGSCF